MNARSTIMASLQPQIDTTYMAIDALINVTEDVNGHYEFDSTIHQLRQIVEALESQLFLTRTAKTQNEFLRDAVLPMDYDRTE